MYIANTVMHARNLPVIPEYQPKFKFRQILQADHSIKQSYQTTLVANKFKIQTSKLKLVNLPKKPQLYFQ